MKDNKPEKPVRLLNIVILLLIALAIFGFICFAHFAWKAGM